MSLNQIYLASSGLKYPTAFIYLKHIKFKTEFLLSSNCPLEDFPHSVSNSVNRTSTSLLKPEMWIYS